jgi:hypothetical protein
MPLASRSVFRVGPGVAALKKAVSRLNDTFRTVLG